jgi:hypothetical protein
MNDSKLYLFLLLLIGNYFFTLLIIGLVAAWVSLLSKPKPLKINTVAEAFLCYYMLFPVGIGNLINFAFHVFFVIRRQSLSAEETVRFRLKWDLPVSASA